MGHSIGVPRFDKLLVLDLDETLVFATERPLSDREAHFRRFGYHVYRRPGLDAFLETLGPAENVRTIEKRGWRR
ncbi:MAG: NIF family HAD-type phosphatase [Sandaracinaceae bacterium]